MAQVPIIYGKSASGKSRSLKNFGEDEIFLVNVEGKALPFRRKFRYTINTDNIETIKKGLLKMPCKTAVIDDAGYLLTNTFMRGHSSGRTGSGVYDLYNDIADSFWGLIKFIKTQLPEDVIVYILMHEDTNDLGITKLKTIGRLLDDKVCVEGMTTIVLRCMTVDGRHVFRTVTDGMDITKAPEDMFQSEEIENDLKAVDDTIRDYYGIKITAEQADNNEKESA